ncbi:MAG: DUF1080 domain-containing protein [Phycisphaera sp.]|nr:DUF1080 domain-containing protein [Phycisphaera sp.]
MSIARTVWTGVAVCVVVTGVLAGVRAADKPLAEVPPLRHPDSSGWDKLIDDDLSNMILPGNVWSVTDGIMTATEDKNIFTKKKYKDFVLDLEFKTADGTNSGVVVHCSDAQNWIPNAVEIQIADDYSEHWSKADPTWQCAAIFGHLAPTHSAVKKPGEWNRYTITCKGKMIYVLLNGQLVTVMDMAQWTSGKKNPDGSDIPGWMPKPFAELPLEGHIGFQGKHAGAPIWFRNVRIKELASE